MMIEQHPPQSRALVYSGVVGPYLNQLQLFSCIYEKTPDFRNLL